jgi:putative oxidoreductase
MAQAGLPLPGIAAVVAIVLELIVGIAVALGVWTRPLALLLAVYTLATALMAHHFWTMEGTARYANTINFYKNLGIMGGFFLLYLTGPGRYSLDVRLGGTRGRRSAA